MSFSYNPSSPVNRDRLRLLIPDTDPVNYMFEDAELDLFLSIFGELHLAHAASIRTIATDKAKLAIFYQISEEFELDRREVPKYLIRLAEQIEERAVSVPFELESMLDHVVDDAGIDRSNYPDTTE